MTASTRLPVPRLAGVSEAAALGGISRQQLASLRKHQDFPRPIPQELACGTIWVEADLIAYFAIPRRPGRPGRKG